MSAAPDALLGTRILDDAGEIVGWLTPTSRGPCFLSNFLGDDPRCPKGDRLSAAVLGEAIELSKRYRRQHEEPDATRGVAGPDRTGLAARQYVPMITGHEVSAAGYFRCANHVRHANGDRTPSAKCYGPRWWCYSCNMGGRSRQLLAIVIGVGEQKDSKWLIDDPEQRAQLLAAHQAIFPGSA